MDADPRLFAVASVQHFALATNAVMSRLLRQAGIDVEEMDRQAHALAESHMLGNRPPKLN